MELTGKRLSGLQSENAQNPVRSQGRISASKRQSLHDLRNCDSAICKQQGN
jgi:hypothetical protein